VTPERKIYLKMSYHLLEPLYSSPIFCRGQLTIESSQIEEEACTFIDKIPKRHREGSRVEDWSIRDFKTNLV
jgi:hypothetical protein